MSGQVAATRRIAKGKPKADDQGLFDERPVVLDEASWAVGARSLHQSARKLRQSVEAKPHLMHRHGEDVLGYLERLRRCVGAPVIPRMPRVDSRRCRLDAPCAARASGESLPYSAPASL